MVGLNQFRIKRLFAYSTISHLGFILLALSINSNDLKGMIKYDSLKEFFNLNNKSEANLDISKQNPQTEDFTKIAQFTRDAIKDTLKEDNISYDNANTKKVTFTIENIILSSSLTSLISVLTLIILFFLLIPNE